MMSNANTTLHAWLGKMEIDSPRYLPNLNFFLFILGLLAKTPCGRVAITDLDAVHMAPRQHELAPTETG